MLCCTCMLEVTKLVLQLDAVSLRISECFSVTLTLLPNHERNASAIAHTAIEMFTINTSHWFS